MKSEIKIGIGILVGVMLLTTIFFVVNANGNNTSEEEITILGLLPLTGNAAVYGESMQRGAELAISEINANGGINGKMIKVKYEDTKGDVQTALTQFKSNTNVNGVMTLISGVVLSLAPEADSEKIILMNLGAKSPKISEAGDYTFSVIPNSDYDEKVFAEYVKNELKINKVAILQINSDYGEGTAGAFKKYFTALGGEVSIVEKYASTETDYRTSLSKIKETNPEGILLVGYKEIANAMIQIKQLGITAQLLGGEPLLSEEILTAAKGTADGLILHTPDFSETSKRATAKEFIEKYYNTYGKVADLSSANAYDAIKLFAKGISEVGTDGEALKNWLYNVKDYDGVSSIITFDENGDVMSPIKIVKIMGETIVDVE